MLIIYSNVTAINQLVSTTINTLLAMLYLIILILILKIVEININGQSYACCDTTCPNTFTQSALSISSLPGSQCQAGYVRGITRTTYKSNNPTRLCFGSSSIPFTNCISQLSSDSTTCLTYQSPSGTYLKSGNDSPIIYVSIKCLGLLPCIINVGGESDCYLIETDAVKAMAVGVIVGIVLGAVGGLALIIWCCCRYCRSTKNQIHTSVAIVPEARIIHINEQTKPMMQMQMQMPGIQFPGIGMQVQTLQPFGMYQHAQYQQQQQFQQPYQTAAAGLGFPTTPVIIQQR